MLAQRIKTLLTEHPHWGAITLARHLGTSPKVIRVVASREGIHFMDRCEVEAFADKLRGARTDGQA